MRSSEINKLDQAHEAISFAIQEAKRALKYATAGRDDLELALQSLRNARAEIREAADEGERQLFGE